MCQSIFLFSFFYLISFILVLSCSDWFMMWLGLEINMMSFILLIYKQYSMVNIESCYKYFFVQSLGSAMFMAMFYFNSYMMKELGMLILSYKVGAGPFYFWFPSMCMGMTWGSCFLLMSLQKIMPMVLMEMMINSYMWIIVIFSLIVGVMGSFNQSNMKCLMAYSSIHHIGWMMMCFVGGYMIWGLYLYMYMLVLLGIFMFMSEMEVNKVYMINMLKGKVWMIFMMLSMAGMPPLVGFFLKWMAFSMILKMNLSYLIFMIFMSVTMFYIYIRVIYDILMGMGDEFGWFHSEYFKLNKMNFEMAGLMGFVVMSCMFIMLL